jgi:hypothetical protein
MYLHWPMEQEPSMQQVMRQAMRQAIAQRR